MCVCVCVCVCVHRFVLQRKKGCWTSRGDHLLVPQWTPIDSVCDTNTNTHTCHPALTLMDCGHRTALANTSTNTVNITNTTNTTTTTAAAAVAAVKRTDATSKAATAVATLPAAATVQPQAALTSFAPASTLMDTDEPVSDDEPANAKEDVASDTQSVWDTYPQAQLVYPVLRHGACRSTGLSGYVGHSGVHSRGEGVLVRRDVTVPVSGWVTCVSDVSQAVGGWPAVLVGTLSGQLLVLGEDGR